MQGKLVSAVCHGPAAFTEAELDGQPLVKGKKVTMMSLNLLPATCTAADRVWGDYATYHR